MEMHLKHLKETLFFRVWAVNEAGEGVMLRKKTFVLFCFVLIIYYLCRCKLKIFQIEHKYYMMKNLLFTILCVLPLVAWGQRIEVDGIKYTVLSYDNSTNTGTVQVGTGGTVAGQEAVDLDRSGEIIIPETVNVSDPNSNYYGWTFTVVKIGHYAFEGCYNITSVSIPKTVEKIESNSFSHCPSLTSVSLSEGLTSIGGGVFNDSGLTSLEIPASVEEIDYGIYENCPALERIVVREGNARYDSRNNCNAIIETATNTLISGCKNTKIINGIETIGYSAFKGCSGLASIHIPASVKSISNSFLRNPFEGSSGLVSITVDSDNPVYDSRNDCNAIISTANDSLILGCVNTIIPDDIKVIGRSAFSGCTGLTSIEIPSEVDKIYQSAFNCKNVKTITCHSTTPPTIFEYSFKYYYEEYDPQLGITTVLSDYIYNNAILYVPTGCVPKYKEAEEWKRFKKIAEIGGEPWLESRATVDFTGEEGGEDMDIDIFSVEINGFDLYYYNLKYSYLEGCMCIKTTLTDGKLEEMISHGYEDAIWNAAYSGTIMRARKGEGILRVIAKTPGNRVLKVKIGDQQPIVKQVVGEKEYFEIPYKSDKDCSVYFYSDEVPTSTAKLRSTDEMVKIYSLGWDIIYDPYAVSSEGDVNQDSQVTTADVAALLEIILDKDNGATPQYDHHAADVNGDGEVTIADVTALVNKLIGK